MQLWIHEILKSSAVEQEQVLLSLLDALGEHCWYSNSTIILREISLGRQRTLTMIPEHFHHHSAPPSSQYPSPLHIIINSFIIISSSHRDEYLQ